MATEDEAYEYYFSTPFHFQKYAVFTALWTLMNMNPARYAVLIDCDSKDGKYLGDERKPLVLLEDNTFVDGNRKYRQSGVDLSTILAKETPLDVKEQFVDCVNRKIHVFHDSGLRRKTGRDVPSEQFCCNLYHKTTKMYLYDKEFSRLYYFGEYKADEYSDEHFSDGEALKWDTEKFTKRFPTTLRNVFAYFKKFFDTVLMKELNCKYIKPYCMDDHSPILLKHKRFNLFTCLKNGVINEDGWKSVDVQHVFK